MSIVLFPKRCGWMASLVSEEAHGHIIGYGSNLRAINKRPGKGMCWSSMGKREKASKKEI